MFDFLTRYTFGNPDFGRSDIWHLSLPLRYFFATALKHGTVPPWSKDIGTGFPILAEGEVGMLHPVNLILYRFLPVVSAINLSYAISYLTLFLGCFLYARAIKLSKLTAVFFAFIFTFSGITVTQVRAPQFLQALGYLPWLFLGVELYLASNKKRWLLMLSIAVGLQLLAGYPQIFVISSIGLAIYTIFKLRAIGNIRRQATAILSLTGSFCLGLLIASPQLLATWQLIQFSGKSGGLDVSFLAQFPYHPKNLISFLNPYLWGDPRIGTYPRFDSNWGVFWESTGYFGLVPFLISLISLAWIKVNKLNKIYWVTALTSLVLLLGKFTPFFFVLQIPPLSFFRVPARFLILFVWSLAILSGLTLEKIRARFPKLAALLFFVTIIDLGSFALNYSPIIDTQKWLAKPETVKILEKDTSWYRTYSVIPADEWNNIFLVAGWKNIDQYFNFRNSLDPDQNLFWNISSANIYSGIYPRRQEIYRGLIDSGFMVSGPNLKVSSSSAKLLSLAGAKYVISPRKLEGGTLHLVASTSGQPPFYIYQNPDVLPHAYLARNYTVAVSVADLIEKTTTSSSATVLETLVNLPRDAAQGEVLVPATVEVNSDNEVTIQVTNLENDSLLVLSDSYYPVWKAYLDKRETRVYPANINQRAVLVPSGSHKITFKLQLL